ncbi:hypothetical protein [Streptomyces sp. NPDC023838]|uniref:hypothetical protein n=1 Tax=Streptomyces sp. NPDC023838 TaxID=3154325 RepID=UPI0033DAF849
MDHTRRRRHRLVPVTLLAVGLVLAGCSSGGGQDEPPPAPTDTAQTDDSTGAPPPEPTGTSDDTSGQQGNGGTDGNSGGSGGSGGFNTAGRVSTDFDGVWPSVKVTFTNHASDTYSGTATVYDCSPTGRWTSRTAPQPVNLEPDESVTLEWVFENTSHAPLIPVHVACVKLTGNPNPQSSSFPADTVPPEPEEEPEEPQLSPPSSADAA